MDESPLWHLQKRAPNAREQELRSFLGGFNFRGDDVNSKVGPMSGGEKARLALALIVWERPNLLLLDEPTNHLDLEMRHALTMALQDFVGALLVVSHDRALLEATTDSFWLVADGTVHPFEGDLEGYRQWRLDKLSDNSKPSSSSDASSTSRKEQKRAAAQNRQRTSQLSKPVQQRITKLDREMEALNQEKSELDSFMGTPDAYAEENRARLAEGIKRQGEIGAKLAELEEQWLELNEQLEALQADDA